MSHSAFFYGTLMHPDILKRVIQNDGEHLSICPAVLTDYTRHHVKGADFPGIIPYFLSRTALGGDLPRDERCVRGSLVTGLTPHDMARIHRFEGSYYILQDVVVHPLGDKVPLPEYTLVEAEEDGASADPAPAPAVAPAPQLPDPLPSSVTAVTYVFRDMSNLDLKAGIWSFEDFVRDKALYWIRV